MKGTIPSLPILWSIVLSLILFALILIISAATYTPVKMAVFTLTNSCATPTRTPEVSATPWPTHVLTTPRVNDWSAATPFAMLRFPHNDATLTRLRAVQFDDHPTDNIVEVVFRQNYQIYYIQRCNDWICPLSQHLADGYYDWYVRMCDGNVCWRIAEIWHFTLQRDG